MIRLLVIRTLDRIARRLRTVAGAVEHRSDLLYRAHSRAEIAKAERIEQRAKIERVIAESRTPSERIPRVGSPLHRDR